MLDQGKSVPKTRSKLDDWFYDEKYASIYESLDCANYLRVRRYVLLKLLFGYFHQRPPHCLAGLQTQPPTQQLYHTTT